MGGTSVLLLHPDSKIAVAMICNHSRSPFAKDAREAIAENPKATADYKAGKESALQSFIGAVMKKTKGRAHPAKRATALERRRLFAQPATKLPEHQQAAG